MKFKNLIPLFLVSILLSCGKETITQKLGPDSFGGGSEAPSSGSLPMRWPANRFPLAVRISEDFTLEEKAQIHNMKTAWEAHTGGLEIFEKGLPYVPNIDDPDLDNYADNEIGIYISNGWYNGVSHQALAITQFFGTTKRENGQEFLELFHSDIMMNYSHFDFTLNISDPSGYDMPSVVLHELGHLLGLGHITSAEAVMQPAMGVTEAKHDPLPADIQALNNNYAHLLALTPQQNGHHMVVGKSLDDLGLKEGQKVRGIFHHMADGSCHHYLDGKLVRKH